MWYSMIFIFDEDCTFQYGLNANEYLFFIIIIRHHLFLNRSANLTFFDSNEYNCFIVDIFISPVLPEAGRKDSSCYK